MSTIINDYSQFNEQQHFLTLLNDLPTGESPQYLDVGAYDGVEYSATAALHDLGWKGTCIEPNSEAAQNIRTVRGDACDVIEAAATGTDAQSVEYFLPDTDIGMLAAVAAPTDAARQAFNGAMKSLGHVPAVNIVDVVKGMDDLWFMSLDTEGSELELLRAMAEAECLPPVVLCEVNYEHAEARRLFDEIGYDIYGGPFGNINYLLLRKDLADFRKDQGPRMVAHIKVAAVMNTTRFGPQAATLQMMSALQPLGINIQMAGGAFWGHTQQDSLERALLTGAEFIITLDYDSMVTRRHVERLLYIMATRPDIDALAPMQLKRDNRRPLMSLYDRDSYDQPGGEAVIKLGPDPIRCRTAHFGCTIIRASALLKMPKPWFHQKPGDDGTWRVESGRIDPDIWFWLEWDKAGNTLYTATDVCVGHLCESVLDLDERGEAVFMTIDQWRQHNGLEPKKHEETKSETDPSVGLVPEGLDLHGDGRRSSEDADRPQHCGVGGS